MGSTVVIIIVSLLFSAFFSGMEIAYVNSNKIHIEIEKLQGGFLSKILTKLTKRPSKFITTMLVGNNIALVVYAFYMGSLLVYWLYPEYVGSDAVPARIIVVQALLATLILLITAEFLPKALFQIYSNTLLKVLAVPAYLFYKLFSVIAEIVIWISEFILRVFFKVEGNTESIAFSKVELGDYITEQMEQVDEDEDVDSEIQIFQNALEFSDHKARDIMIPRTEICAAELHELPKNLVNKFVETGYSKILVYKDTIDDIIGYVHSFELFKKPRTIKSVMLPVEFVPETMPISDILGVLTKRRKSIAVVLDEYGGTSGILTVEDIVEELFGEIEDEHDTIELFEEKINDKEYNFSARLEVSYVNETYKLELPESENYDTIGGLIVNQIGEIPEKGEKIKIDNFQFKVLQATNTKIELLHLKVLEDD
ncbi:Hemolysin, contains CBS domains [Zhouia amylolytica]|uniref:Hemolysin, contains CBS domains n=1 Tax=Zhouia amylolytica TaxID=376730 RepID=A0A1I6P2N7_9FLAO|nr:hemolysin family protein [Zhouia amylolytica]SFS34461.1 Hemolysin, contains CBS domains [Zhouia amylolytica]